LLKTEGLDSTYAKQQVTQKEQKQIRDSLDFGTAGASSNDQQRQSTNQDPSSSSSKYAASSSGGNVPSSNVSYRNNSSYSSSELASMDDILALLHKN